MNYTKLFLFLVIFVNTQSIVAMTINSDKETIPEVVIELDKKGTVDAIDPNGKWILIASKKYALASAGSIKLEGLRSGLRVHFNVEKAKGERNGTITHMWIEKKK